MQELANPVVNLQKLEGYQLREIALRAKRNRSQVAERLLQSCLAEINRRGQEVAKKYGKRYRPLSVNELR